jgi:hypothetical protein
MRVLAYCFRANNLDHRSRRESAGRSAQMPERRISSNSHAAPNIALTLRPLRGLARWDSRCARFSSGTASTHW